MRSRAHRRQLVHPLAVIALVVRVVVRRIPAVPHESRLHLRQRVLGHQNIDIGEQAALRGAQSGETDSPRP